MKCEFCGANIDIETDKCPYCNMTKTQFASHRADMNKYASSYQDVKENVIAHNKRTTEKIVRVAIVAILCSLIALMIVLIGLSPDIVRKIQANEVVRSRAEHIKNLDAYEANTDWIGFCTYYDRNNIRRAYESGVFDEYNFLYAMATDYAYCVSNLYDVIYYNKVEPSYDYFESDCDMIISSFEEFVKEYNEYGDGANHTYIYSDECFTDRHLESYQIMYQDLCEIIMTYAGFTEEEFEEFLSASKPKKIIMIEEGLIHE